MERFQSLPQKVSVFIKEHGLISPREEITLAVSGGADSVAMFFCFLNLKKELDINFSVHHIEHGIRAESSLKDAAFVERLCSLHKVPFRLSKVLVPKVAESLGLSIEEAARKLRYEELFKEASIVATAHNLNDNAETVILNLARGSGLKGLCGIFPVTNADNKRLIRPLLCASREEIEEYLSSIGADYCTDETNTDRVYSRNLIRHDIIPLLERINPKVISNINRTAQVLSGLKEYNDIIISDILKDATSAGHLDTSAITILPEALQKMCITEWIRQNTGGAHNVGRIHIDSVLGLLGNKTGKSIDIPGYCVYKEYESLKICEKKRPKEAGIKKPVKVTMFPFLCNYGGFRINLRAYEKPKDFIPEDIAYTKYLDYDKVKEELSIRQAGGGEYFTIKGYARKAFKRFCIDEKIPASKRKEIPLICEGGHILWAVGYRISEYYKISGDTKRIIEIAVEEIKDV